MKFKLRPHQKKQNKAVRKSLKKHSHVLYGASTGWGKSVCILDFVQREIDKGGRVLVIAPRRKLVKQLMGTFQRERPALLMGADTKGNHRRSSMVIASLSTLHRRLEKYGADLLGDITKIIVDEAHISFNMPDGKPSVSTAKLHELYWDKIPWIGFTATPITAGGYRLEGWDETVYKYDAAWLIENGWLAKFDYYSVPSMDVRGLKVQSSTGDFSVSDMETLTNTATSIQSVIDNYKKYCSGKTLIFAASIVHGELIQKGFESDGITTVECIHSNLSESKQQEILDNYECGITSILVNVAMLTTGFDDPEVESLIIARPIGSVRLAIQVYGRALRMHPDIPKVTILDLCSVWDTTNILPDMTPNWNKTKRKRGESDSDDDENSIEDVVWECESCNKPFQMIQATRETETTEDVIVTTYFCPHCDMIAKVDTKDLSTPEIEKIKTTSDIDYDLRSYSGKEVIEVIARLVALNTRAKTSWAAYIHSKCMGRDRKAYREVVYGYDQEVFSPSMAWRRLMDIYGN